jgi:hypothetical protein
MTQSIQKGSFMPQKLLASYILICERVIEEKDGVLSVIRMADFYGVPPAALESTIGVRLGIQLQAAITAKAVPEDTGEHHFAVKLIRPKGEYSLLLEKSQRMRSRIFGSPGGASFTLKLGSFVKEMGTHYVTLEADGEEVARAPFTVAIDEIVSKRGRA